MEAYLIIIFSSLFGMYLFGFFTGRWLGKKIGYEEGSKSTLKAEGMD